MKSWLDRFDHKRVVILGYGLEGQSTYRVLKQHCPNADLQIMDRNTAYVKAQFADVSDLPYIYEEQDYMAFQSAVDYVFKSPGIPLMRLEGCIPLEKVTSQSNEFISAYRGRTIGITGTKGKSTTATFTTGLLEALGKKVQLIGNIGKPAFDYVSTDYDNDFFVYELSSHQLETVSCSPRYAVVLNLFEEHLDHYRSYDAYAEAKMNIARYQTEEDWYIYSAYDASIQERCAGFAGRQLVISDNLGSAIYDTNEAVEMTHGIHMTLTDDMAPNIHGHHFLINMAVGIQIAALLGEVDTSVVRQVMADFKGLRHRLSYVATACGIRFYNDSISTIPQATIAAVKALSEVRTVIIGGMDRGIDYHLLEEFIHSNEAIQWIMMPDSGHKLAKIIGERENIHLVANLEEAVEIATKVTKEGDGCLLSPAAASYGFFKNFEERGNTYEMLVLGLEK